MKKVMRPKRLSTNPGSGRGIEARILYPENPDAEGSFCSDDPDELLRLAKWLEQAACWFEQKQLKGGR
jgi:hypothetical protein